jgi:uncharacterized protein YbaA (DUF1428 family)
MGRYIDGFILAIPKRNRARYLRMARLGARVWLEHGALEYHECIADDVPYGKRTSFPRSVKMRPDETVWFSWIVYKSRKHRDAVNAKCMKDARLEHLMDPKKLPFDAKRMIFGGFKALLDR